MNMLEMLPLAPLTHFCDMIALLVVIIRFRYHLVNFTVVNQVY